MLVRLSSVWKAPQRLQERRWRRTGALALGSRPSATSASSIRTCSQESNRASEASASERRARTSSDLMLGTVVSMASAIWS